MKTKIEKLKKQGLSYRAIGCKFGLSRQRIHQILYPEKLKKYSQSKKYKKIQRDYYRKNKKQLQNLCLEICGLVESGILSVSAFGVSQDSVDFARKNVIYDKRK